MLIAFAIIVLGGAGSFVVGETFLKEDPVHVIGEGASIEIVDEGELQEAPKTKKRKTAPKQAKRK